MFQTYGPRTNLRVDGAWKCGESIWEGVVGVGGFPKSEAQGRLWLLDRESPELSHPGSEASLNQVFAIPRP